MPETFPTGAAIAEARWSFRQLGPIAAGAGLGLVILVVIWLLILAPQQEAAEARALACEEREAACAERLDTCYLGAKAGMGAAEGTR